MESVTGAQSCLLTIASLDNNSSLCLFGMSLWRRPRGRLAMMTCGGTGKSRTAALAQNVAAIAAIADKVGGEDTGVMSDSSATDSQPEAALDEEDGL